jgi:hypothetical protein
MKINKIKVMMTTKTVAYWLIVCAEITVITSVLWKTIGWYAGALYLFLNALHKIIPDMSNIMIANAFENLGTLLDDNKPIEEKEDAE